MLVNMSGGKKVENIINEIVAPTLVWTNPTPTTTPASNLNLQFTGDWDAYFVECKANASNVGGTTFINYVRSDGSGFTKLISFDEPSPSAGDNFVRNILGVGRNYMNLQGGVYINTTIPTRIWGAKFTL